MKRALNTEVFMGLKTGDIISNKQDLKGGPAGYDYEVVEGYHYKDGEGCIRIRLIFGKDDKYKGQPYEFYLSQLDCCIGMYKKTE